jgi:NTP pyrophosphatase (non-canonical NTP hydrolase)
MTNPFKDQKEFMLAAEQTVDCVNPDQCELYAGLVEEEINEFYDADTTEEATKELIDVIVVLIGAAYSAGIDIEEAWNRVHASNMSKLVGGKLVKNEAGKVLKPDTYAPPVLTDLIPEEVRNGQE